MKELFRHVDFHIEGWENLPNESGHIFIYNHLINHESYTLPNDFQITLDSHFLSAMILDVKYDDPGIRIVRIPDDGEYGHQNYCLVELYIPLCDISFQFLHFPLLGQKHILSPPCQHGQQIYHLRELNNIL